MSDNATPPLDPDIKAFRDAESDAVRAGVLLAAPVGTLMRWREVFDRFSAAVGFAEGTAYLATLSEAQRRRRHRGVIDTFELAGATSRLVELIERSLPLRIDG